MELFIDIFIISLQKRVKKRTFQSRILFHSLIDFADSFPFITDKKRKEEKNVARIHTMDASVCAYIDTLLPGFPFHLIYYFARRTNESVIFSLLDDISTWKMISMLRSIFFSLSVNSVQSSIEAWHFSAFQSTARLPLLRSTCMDFLFAHPFAFHTFNR